MRFIKALPAVTIILSLLVACAGQQEPVDESEPAASNPGPTNTVAVAEASATATMIPPTETSPPPEPTELPPLEEPTAAPTVEPTEVVVAEDLSEDSCLDCHRDKERLIETAAPEEEAPPSESSGVG